jgi:amino acid permease
LLKCGIADPDFYGSWKYRAIQGAPTAALVLLPLSMIKDMSGFRHISVVSIFALLYTGMVLFVELPAYIHKNYEHAEIVPAYFDWNFFTGASITFFAYTCQVQLLPIYSELVNPNEKRIKKIISRSVLVDVMFYVTIALAGYFSTYNNTPKIVLDRDSIDGNRDYALMIAQISIVMVLFVAVPVNYNPFRNQIFYMFFKKDDYSFKENLVCTVSFISITCFIAIVYPNVSDVLGILGGLNATAI